MVREFDFALRGLTAIFGGCFLFISGCSLFNISIDWYPRASHKFHQQFKSQLNEVGEAYRSELPVLHFQRTIAMHSLIDQASIPALIPEVRQVARKISREGLTPYASIAVELSYRLGRVQHPRAQSKFSLLAKAAIEAEDNAHQESSHLFSGIVRWDGERAFRRLDANSARAIARLALSEFGREQFLRGQTTGDLIRSLAMTWECEEQRDKQSDLSAQALEQCERFRRMIGSRLNRSGQGNVLPKTLNDLSSGTRISEFNCFRSQQPGSDMIEEVAAFGACIANQARQPQSWHVDGSTLASDWTGQAPAQPGYRHVKSTESVYHGPNGNTATQVKHEYTNNEGGSLTITDYSAIIDGEEETGRHIESNDGQGNSHEEYQDKDGNVTYSFTEHSNGNTESYQENKDGSSWKVTTDSETGETTIEATDKDGNVKTGKISENGQCTGEACNMSTPVDDEFSAPACVEPPQNPRTAKQISTADPMGPLIYPSPDTVPESGLLSCALQNTATFGVGEPCPPSVALCIEPPPPGTCGCGTVIQGQPGARYAGRCAEIRCAEGSECNPETGTCQAHGSTGSLSGLSPGILPPPPPIEWVPPGG